MSLALLLEPEMADIWVSGSVDIDSLSPSQRLRFVVFLMVSLRSFEDAYFQWREGRLETDSWNSLLRSLIDVKSTAGFDRFWKIRKHHFHQNGAADVESIEAKEVLY